MSILSNAPSQIPRLPPKDLASKTSFGSVRPVNDLRQPRYVPSSPGRKPVTVARMPAEPEDAHITGATRSLSRRLLALNMRQVS